MVEILKQDQYVPIVVSKQILTIYAASAGLLDDLPIEHCRPFEQELYKFFDVHHKELLDKMADKGGMSDEVKDAVRKGMDECKKQFLATHGSAA